MFKTIVLLMTLFLLSACSPQPSVSPAPPAPTTEAIEMPEIRILALGDSLTAGFGVVEEMSYPAQLEARLLADGYSVEVINGGISGETSSGALSRTEWMLNTQPDIVIVEIGANDALRGIDLELTAANIDEIVRKFSESGAVVVVAGMQIIQNLGDDYVDTFKGIYPDVAEKHGAILIPFFLEGVAADPDLNQPDFIHPTAEGYTILVDHIYGYVLQAIEKTVR